MSPEHEREPSLVGRFLEARPNIKLAVGVVSTLVISGLVAGVLRLKGGRQNPGSSYESGVWRDLDLEEQDEDAQP